MTSVENHRKVTKEVQENIDNPATSKELKFYLTAFLANDRTIMIGEVEMLMAEYYFGDA